MVHQEDRITAASVTTSPHRHARLPRERRACRARRRRLCHESTPRPVLADVDSDAGEIAGLVYVNAFAPEAGENCFQLAGMFPGSMLGEETARPVSRGDGTTDLYIAPDSFHEIFCQDVPAPQAALMAATQRPATQEALVEPSGDRPLEGRAVVVLDR